MPGRCLVGDLDSLVEIGFLYRIAPAARWALKNHPDRTLSQWRTRQLYPPAAQALVGEDRVGVLLCGRRYGELWMGFRTEVSTGLEYGTNATQLRVAAGVLAGWSQLGTREGIHFADDLNWREFLRIAQQVLGPPLVVQDELAVARSLRERRVDGVRRIERSGSRHRRHRQYVAFDLGGDALRDAAEQQPLESRVTSGADDEQVRPKTLHDSFDRKEGRAFLE
jgi:hypothetical protein